MAPCIVFCRFALHHSVTMQNPCFKITYLYLRLTARHPSSGGLILLLDDVVADRSTAIIIWLLPFEVTAVLRHVRDIQRTSRWSWMIQDGDLDFGRVTSIFIGSLDDVSTSVRAQSTFAHEFGLKANNLFLKTLFLRTA